MSKSMRQFLKEASYDGKSRYDFEIAGEIAKCASGEIVVVRVDGQNEPWILKSINLDDQNFFAVTKGLSVRNKTLRGANFMDHILYFSTSKRDCRKWAHLYHKKDSRLAKVAWISKQLAVPRDGATEFILANEYLNEACVGRIISQLQLPHVIKTHDAYIEDRTGYILMDYGGTSLTRAMVDFTLAEFKSVVMQVLLFLAVAQETLYFKHHDIHLDNIFVNRLKDTVLHKGISLKSKNTWAYKFPNGTVFYVDHHNVLAKLGDFGLASITEPKDSTSVATRFERVDYPYLDAAEYEWGAWNGKYETQKSYDIVTFLTKFFLEEKDMVPEACLTWIQQMFSILCSLDTTISASNIGRPLREQEGNISAFQFLQHSFFDEFKSTANEAFFLN